jgi:hypothetical protein
MFRRGQDGNSARLGRLLTSPNKCELSPGLVSVRRKAKTLQGPGRKLLARSLAHKQQLTKEEYMSKNKNDGEKLVEDLRKMKKNSLTDKVQDVVTFIKFLIGFSFAVAIGFLGAYAIVKGLKDSGLKRDAFVVSGACAVVQSLYLMWLQVIKRS